MHTPEEVTVSFAFMYVRYTDVYISDNEFGKNKGVVNLQYAGDLY